MGEGPVRDSLMVNGVQSLKGEVQIPGDKSVSHRAVLLGALAQGTTVIDNFLFGDDCLCSIDCLRQLGAKIEIVGNRVVIYGEGAQNLHEPTDVLNVGNSGTSLRLLLGILAGLGHYAVITGDNSIRRRPMGRVVEPLRAMGANLNGRRNGEFAPITVNSRYRLRGIRYQSPVASAQVKSAIILAGLFSEGETSVTEPEKSRDHTERMLERFGVDIGVQGRTVTVCGGQSLTGVNIAVPGDISSAAFFLVAASIIPDSELVLRGVGLNPTRIGILEVLEKMGANIEVFNRRNEYEPVGDIRVRSAHLYGTTIEGDVIPRLIDEIPVLAVAAACAQGTTIIRDAAELKVKESNRIDTVCSRLREFGVTAVATDDGMEIIGAEGIRAPEAVSACGDHRIAMSMAVLGAKALCGKAASLSIDEAAAVSTSFPDFDRVMGQAGVRLSWS